MQLLHQLYNPQSLQVILGTGGYLLMVAIIFAETGLLVGFFLPGDSMLFIAGFMASTAPPGFPVGSPPVFNIWVLIPLLCLAAVVGDSTGFLIGRKAGPALFAREDSRFFKRSHLLRAHAFYEKHGPKTIVLARFVPIVRTFVPTVAGAADMDYRQFVTYNVAGGVGWIVLMALLGYYFGQMPIVQKNLEKAVLIVVLLSLLPMVVHAWQEKAKSRNAGTVPLPGVEVEE